jgi:hypothetical protein
MEAIELEVQARVAFPFVLWAHSVDEGEGWYKLLVVDLGKMMQWGADRVTKGGKPLRCELARDPEMEPLTKNTGRRLRLAALTVVEGAGLQSL